MDTMFTLPKTCCMCAGAVTCDNMDDYEQVTMLLDSQPDVELMCERCQKVGASR